MSKSATDIKNMPFSVITLVWLEEHAAFLVKCFIKTESYRVGSKKHVGKKLRAAIEMAL